jgi:hypothetical protein
MARWLISLRKAINTNGIAYKWSNTYFAEAGDAVGALGIGARIWLEGERLFHKDLAFLYEVYVNETGDAPFSPGSIGTVDVGVRRGLSIAGPSTTDVLLPPFNVVRVDFSVVSSRPSLKFYRLPLMEGDITAGQLVQARINEIQAGLAGLAGITSLVDVDGQDWTGSASIKSITSRRLGREASLAVPVGPAFG